MCRRPLLDLFKPPATAIWLFKISWDCDSSLSSNVLGSHQRKWKKAVSSWWGGVGKVGNLAGSQACPPGLLMPSHPGDTSAHLGCENRGRDEEETKTGLREEDIEKGNRWRDSRKGSQWRGQRKGTLLSNSSDFSSIPFWVLALLAAHKHGEPVESFTPLWRVPFLSSLILFLSIWPLHFLFLF